MGESHEFIEALAEGAAIVMDAAEALLGAGKQALQHIIACGCGGDDFAGGGDG